jgi:hypothetical protein
MMRKLAAIGLTLAAVIVLAAGGPGSTILVDDFSEGNDDAWER